MKQPPPPPDVLDATGQTEWTRVVGLLVERGHWDPLRSTVLLAYCEAYADWHRMTAQVRGREVVLQGGTRTVDDAGPRHHRGREGRAQSAAARDRPRTPLAPGRPRGAAPAGALGGLTPAPAPAMPTGATPSPSIPGCAIPTRPPRPTPPSATTATSASSGRRRKYGKSMGSRVASSSAGRRSTPG